MRHQRLLYLALLCNSQEAHNEALRGLVSLLKPQRNYHLRPIIPLEELKLICPSCTLKTSSASHYPSHRAFNITYKGNLKAERVVPFRSAAFEQQL